MMMNISILFTEVDALLERLAQLPEMVEIGYVSERRYLQFFDCHGPGNLHPCVEVADDGEPQTEPGVGYFMANWELLVSTNDVALGDSMETLCINNIESDVITQVTRHL